MEIDNIIAREKSSKLHSSTDLEDNIDNIINFTLETQKRFTEELLHFLIAGKKLTKVEQEALFKKLFAQNLKNFNMGGLVQSIKEVTLHLNTTNY